MKNNARKILLLLLMTVGFSCVGFAQQEAQYTQYMFNRLIYNPGYSGSSGSIALSAMYRYQWMGLTLNTPTTDVKAGSVPINYYFSFDMPVKILHGGLGLSAFVDEIGYRKNTNVCLDYAFRMFWGSGNLSAGIEAGLFNTTLDGTQLRGSEDLPGQLGSSGSGAHDPLLTGQKESDMMFDLSIGLYYQVPSVYYIGFSAKNLLATKSDKLGYQNARTFYLMGGYDYALPLDPSFKLKPSAMLKTANFSNFQGEVSCLLEYQSAVWGGLTYRVQDAICFLAGVQWKKLRIGAAYDLTTSKIGSYKYTRSMGSLELYVRFCFKVIIPEKPTTHYRNTRYLF